MGRSNIGWTDKVWNPVTGCTKVSTGCKHCYAEAFSERFRGVKEHPYEQGFDLTLWPERLKMPLHWKKPCRVFVNSMSDLFHEDIPDQFIIEVFTTMLLAKQHIFQVLTKRAERMQLFFGGLYVHPTPNLPSENVWMGVSCENQAMADERIPFLLATPAHVKWVSAEPLLGPIDFGRWMPNLDWVVVGGESGIKHRTCEPEWIYDIVNQCSVAKVPVFVKQDSGLFPGKQGRISSTNWIHEYPLEAL
ncbi:MAG TPA: phage Gp37/Gp68 family protein [Bacteroidota bacterium]